MSKIASENVIMCGVGACGEAQVLWGLSTQSSLGEMYLVRYAF